MLKTMVITEAATLAPIDGENAPIVERLKERLRRTSDTVDRVWLLR